MILPRSLYINRLSQKSGFCIAVEQIRGIVFEGILLILQCICLDFKGKTRTYQDLMDTISIEHYERRACTPL